MMKDSTRSHRIGGIGNHSPRVGRDMDSGRHSHRRRGNGCLVGTNLGGLLVFPSLVALLKRQQGILCIIQGHTGISDISRRKGGGTLIASTRIVATMAATTTTTTTATTTTTPLSGVDIAMAGLLGGVKGCGMVVQLDEVRLKGLGRDRGALSSQQIHNVGTRRGKTVDMRAHLIVGGEASVDG